MDPLWHVDLRLSIQPLRGKNKPTTIQASEGDSSISPSSEGETKNNLDNSDKEVDREEIKNLRNVHS